MFPFGLLQKIHHLPKSTFNLTELMSSAATIKKIKYDGRTKKRKWMERRTDKGAALDPSKRLCTEEPMTRIKRRKYAMLLGYSGVGYLGMQRNPLMKTIEEDLFCGLLKAELITDEAFNQIQTIQYQRAARTDKGVSAARQVVSLKLPEEVNLELANSVLPEVIRIFGVKRVTKGFNSKSQCDGRTYMYMLPTISFARQNEDATQETFRLSDELHLKINDLLKTFTGTKNFHNFTNKKKFNDPSAMRYIMSFQCEPPIVRNGVEFVILKVKGQSFMLHQIRKMVGLVLAIIRGYTTAETLNQAWTAEKVNIPQAPGLGLVLDQVHYERYNHRYGSDGVHEKLDWVEFDDKVNEFKEKYIYPTIINTEINEKCLITWLEEKLAGHRYDMESKTDADDDEGDCNCDDDEDENSCSEIVSKPDQTEHKSEVQDKDKI